MKVMTSVKNMSAKLDASKLYTVVPLLPKVPIKKLTIARLNAVFGESLQIKVSSLRRLTVGK